jgi:hypothetical protein
MKIVTAAMLLDRVSLTDLASEKLGVSQMRFFSVKPVPRYPGIKEE